MYVPYLTPTLKRNSVSQVVIILLLGIVPCGLFLRR